MASPQNFRSAFNGFNREDVVNYISYISTKHETQVNELKNEAEELRSQLAAKEEEVRSAGENAEKLDTLRREGELRQAEHALVRDELNTLKKENERLKAEAAEKETRIAELNETLAARDEELAQLRQEPENARAEAASQPKKPESTGRWTDEELNAYRRAESAERRARERVNQMYDQASGALAEASVRVEQTAGKLGELVAKVEAEVEALRQAMAESENTLADTAVVLGAIRPEMD